MDLPVDNHMICCQGFGSSDAFKADEFSNTLRTNQYRWQLGRELAINKMHLAANKKREAERAQTAPAGASRKVAVPVVTPVWMTPLQQPQLCVSAFFST